MRSVTLSQARNRGGWLLSAARRVIGLLRGAASTPHPGPVPYCQHAEVCNGVEVEPREVQYPHPDSIPKLPQSIFHTER
jgi:hypothetical protein